MNRSESIGALSAALAKAQGQIRTAAKDSNNPFYHSKYADLASVWDACRHALSSNGISVMQFPRATDGGIEVETVLSHGSGEWVSETLSLPASQTVTTKAGKEIERFDAQTIGSAITYARRYALAAFVGVAPDDDDDGNAAAKSSQNGSAALREKGLAILRTAAPKGTPALQLAWETMSVEMKRVCAQDLAATFKPEAAKADAVPMREPGEEG